MTAYKYSCRKCPIRNRCIEESANSPSVKEIVRHAFANRTDTLDTWGLLQPTCLLLKAERERSSTAPQESMLGRRLRLAREAKEQAIKASQQEAALSLDQTQIGAAPAPPEPEEEERPTTIGVVDARLESAQTGQRRLPPCWLTVSVSGRHIALPANGELILGRFDPNIGIPPDVDLSHEDQLTLTVSRRHAKIVGIDGRHTIEDLGSRYGVFLNREPVRSGPSRPLTPGDRIALGTAQMLYDAVPARLVNMSPSANMRHYLIVTPTGRRLTIAPPKDLVIGRADRYIEFVPDIDLSREGEVAIRVSRRHAIITWRDRSPYLEDLGSGFGTRHNGQTLYLGQAVPLRPGDHIWMAGCVLAYDVEF
jgi:pSer/pThr/pTyr-binding forkhead associated (FHA) protein